MTAHTPISKISKLLKPSEAADVLGVCEKTLQQCRARGLRFVTVTRGAIRYREDDLLAYIEDNLCLSELPKPKSGNTTSKSKVFAFEEVVARPTMRRPKR